MRKWIGYLLGAGIAAGTAGGAFSLFCNKKLKNSRKTYSLEEIGEIPQSDFIIVPGCLVHPDGTPSYALEDRLTAALALYEEKKADKIIVSGIAKENQTGRNYLLRHGVAEEDILKDDGGLDTYSTIYRCRDAFLGNQFLICPQEKYFKRTGFLISELGMDGFCVKADARRYQREYYERFRDFFAADKAWLECKVTKPKPKYSLKDLPISY